MDGFPLELFAEFPTCRPGSLPALLRTRSTRSSRQRRAHFAVPLEFFHPRIKLVDAHPKFLRDLRRRPVGGLGETDRFESKVSCGRLQNRMSFPPVLKRPMSGGLNIEEDFDTLLYSIMAAPKAGKDLVMVGECQMLVKRLV